MCCETVCGKVELFGKIRIRPNRFEPVALPELKYIIIHENDDLLGLQYHSVCVDLEVEARGTTINEALNELTSSLNHYIDLAIQDFGREKAYSVLRDERKARLVPENVAFVSYYQVEEHRFNEINSKRINEHNKLLAEQYYSDMIQKFFYFAHLSKIYASRVEAL
jgi:hypothetical protein